MSMTPEWKPCRLDQLGVVGRGRSRHRPRGDAALYGGRHPFIQTADIMSADPYIVRHAQTYSDFGLEQSKLWPANTLCMTIAGANTAKTAILKFAACFPDSVVGFIPEPTKADLHFIKYSLDLLKDRFLAISRGATQDNLSIDKLLSFPIPTPGLAVQRRIAGILSVYDDLIENCNRRIRVLDQMAGALYREWFVLFRYPGHERVPLVESSLGPIPKGWEVAAFSRVAQYVNGFAFKPHHWGSSGLPILKIRELKGGVTESTPRNDGATVPGKHSVADGDLLFSWSADLDAYLWRGGPGLLNQHIFNVVPHAALSRELLFHILREAIPRFRALSLGATMHHIKRVALDQVFLRLPEAGLRERFSALVSPMHHETAVLVKRASNLRCTRNLLLPRLLSGQLSIKDAA